MHAIFAFRETRLVGTVDLTQSQKYRFDPALPSQTIQEERLFS
jgi:hypothetical protein